MFFLYFNRPNKLVSEPCDQGWSIHLLNKKIKTKVQSKSKERKKKKKI